MKHYKYFTIDRSIIVGLAIVTLAGCAQFQNSFGAITDPDSPGTEYVATNAHTAASADKSDDDSGRWSSSDASRERSFIFEGVKVQLSDGQLTQ